MCLSNPPFAASPPYMWLSVIYITPLTPPPLLKLTKSAYMSSLWLINQTTTSSMRSVHLVRWLISAKETLPFPTGFESIQNYYIRVHNHFVLVHNPFVRVQNPFVRVKNLLYVYKTFCTRTKVFYTRPKVFWTRTKCFVSVQKIVYAYKRFCTRTKGFVRVQNILYAYEVFCYLLNLYDHVMLLCHTTRMEQLFTSIK